MEKSLLRRFISYYRPHRKMLALDLGAAFLLSATGMVYPVVTNRMLNDYIPNRLYRSIVIAGLAVLALYVIRMLLRFDQCLTIDDVELDVMSIHIEICQDQVGHMVQAFLAGYEK